MSRIATSIHSRSPANEFHGWLSGGVANQPNKSTFNELISLLSPYYYLSEEMYLYVVLVNYIAFFLTEIHIDMVSTLVTLGKCVLR